MGCRRGAPFTGPLHHAPGQAPGDDGGADPDHQDGGAEREDDRVGVREGERRADRRVAGERRLCRAREDAHAIVGPGRVGHPGHLAGEAHAVALERRKYSGGYGSEPDVTVIELIGRLNLGNALQDPLSEAMAILSDAKRDGDGWRVYTHGGRKPTGLDAVAWAKR